MSGKQGVKFDNFLTHYRLFKNYNYALFLNDLGLRQYKQFWIFIPKHYMDTFQHHKCQNSNDHTPWKGIKVAWPSILTVKNAEYFAEPGISMKCCKTESNINVFYKSFPPLLNFFFIELKGSIMNTDYLVI